MHALSPGFCDEGKNAWLSNLCEGPMRMRNRSHCALSLVKDLCYELVMFQSYHRTDGFVSRRTHPDMSPAISGSGRMQAWNLDWSDALLGALHWRDELRRRDFIALEFFKE